MVSQTTILKILRNFCGSILMIGTAMFLAGSFGIASNLWIGIGIGAVMGAVFIFLMGIFFTVTMEILEGTEAAEPVSAIRQDNIIPFERKYKK